MKYGHYQMIVSIDDGVMDYTWKEIDNAIRGGFIVQALVYANGGAGYFPVTAAYISGDDFLIDCQASEHGFATDSPDGYPVAE